MQKLCELNPSTMAAVLGLPDEKVEEICATITDEVVVPTSYNCTGQIVISGTNAGIDTACELLKAAGAKRALKLSVGGTFHSPLMNPAKEELEKAIKETSFAAPICPVYQNVTTVAETNPDAIKENLIAQLTAPVKWTQSGGTHDRRRSHRIRGTRPKKRAARFGEENQCNRRNKRKAIIG